MERQKRTLWIDGPALMGPCPDSRMGVEQRQSAASVQAVIDGEHREFETSRDAKLVEDVGQMVLDGLLADTEKVGDLLVRGGVNDKADNFALAVGQAEVT